MMRSPLSAPSSRCLFFSTTSRLLTTSLLILLASHVDSASYYGKLIGKLSELHHGVSGEVYAVDGRTLYIKDFTYDGEGPAAFFYAGTSKTPNVNGFRVRDERGTTDVLKRYRKKDVTLTLPEGKSLNNVKWFSVYCDEFAVNFGDVRIPRGFDYPRPQKLPGLNGVHGVSSEPVVVVDAQTLLIPGFSYDGEAPDAKFWVGSGAHPSPQGIRVPDENGKIQPLRRYDRKTIVLTLPDNLTIHQLGHFGVWCEAFTVDFGHIHIPSSLNVPPSLKMLGVSPQSKLNCEVLEDRLAFEVRWAVAGDSIVVQLVAKLDAGQYMSFGVSENPERSVMVGGDVTVAWVDKQSLQGYAVDYFLEAKSQCSGGHGSCPDERIQSGTNSVRLLNAAMVNGYSIVTYQRPLKASDELDRAIRTNGSQAIIWAVGPLNERREVSFHSHYLKNDRLIEFSRPPVWNCPMPDGDMPHVHGNNANKGNKQELVVTTRRPQRLPATPAPAATKGAWEIPPIQCYEPDDGVFYAQMGPTGGKHGYPAITGHVGWGISWYINGLLIPEINVVRGKTYTFVTEGGEDPKIPARYHPFYITDDPIGGYQHKTPEEKANVTIFAGVQRQGGSLRPTGVGRLCNWLPDPDGPSSDEFASFGAYQRTLTLTCDVGEPGWVEWTPDANTPDTVYYQCFTHRYLGWKINVVDHCDEPQVVAASENHEVYVQPPKSMNEQQSDLEIGASTRVASKVTTAPEFHEHHRYLHQNHPPHPNSYMDETMRHELPHHNQHNNYHLENVGSTNNNHAMITPIKTASMFNGKSHNENLPLTAMRLNRPAGLSYENRETYEIGIHPQSYDAELSPPRTYPYQSAKSPITQYNHHNHHHHYQPHHHYNHHHNFPHHASSGGRSRLNVDTSRRQIPIMLTSQSHQLGQAGNINASYDLTSDLHNLPNVFDNSATFSDQEPRHSVTVPITIMPPSSNQASNLVTDKRAIMNYGQMKYAFSHPGTSQYIYSRPSLNHQVTMNNPHKTSQLVIIRKPLVQQFMHRRTILGAMIKPKGGHELSSPGRSSSRPILMDRKKPMYRGSSQKNTATAKQTFSDNNSYNDNNSNNNNSNNDNNNDNNEINLTRMMNQQRSQIEKKISTNDNAISVDANVIKEERNNGFDPDSIVIESGFKPIIRTLERDSNAGRSQEFTNYEIQQDYPTNEGFVASAKDDFEGKSAMVGDDFEPMFVASPLVDRKNMIQQLMKKLRLAQDARRRSQSDDIADAPIAAIGSNTSHLPTSMVNSMTSRKIDRMIGKHYNDKLFGNTNFARTRAQRKMSTDKMTADVIDGTSKLENFEAEKSITHQMRMESLPELENRAFLTENDGSSDDANAKLSSLNRNKRSAQNREIHISIDASNVTGFLPQNHHRNHSEYSYDDHNENQEESSTGEMLIANIHYILLTVVFYYVL